MRCHIGRDCINLHVVDTFNIDGWLFRLVFDSLKPTPHLFLIELLFEFKTEFVNPTKNTNKKSSIVLWSFRS